MPRSNKIENGIPADRLEEFLASLAAMPSPSLQTIADLALSKYKIKVSLMGARTFKKHNFEDYLEKIRKRSEFAKAVAEARTGNPGSNLADAAADLMAQEVFEFMNSNEELANKLATLKPQQLAFVLKSLRSEDRKVEIIQIAQEKWKAKLLQDLKTFGNELKDIIADKSLTDAQKFASARKRLFGILPEDAPTSPGA